jgi:hypothetical protein
MKQGGATSMLGPLLNMFMSFFFFPFMTFLTSIMALYKRLMTFPVRELYVELPGFVMRPLCRLFLTLLPAKYEGANIKEKKKVIFVVNHGLLCK